MNDKIYCADDCAQTGDAMSIKNKVIVIRHDALPDDRRNQLFFCTGGNGANSNPGGRSVFAVSLSTGEHCRWYRNDIVGTLKPELLPDEARLTLARVWPGDDNEGKLPRYRGYCFLPDGRHPSGVWLDNAQDAVSFVKTQAPYQYRILLCDLSDCAVLEMIDGKLVFPTPEEYETFSAKTQPEQTGGMSMT